MQAQVAQDFWLWEQAAVEQGYSMEVVREVVAPLEQANNIVGIQSLGRQSLGVHRDPNESSTSPHKYAAVHECSKQQYLGHTCLSTSADGVTWAPHNQGRTLTLALTLAPSVIQCPSHGCPGLS